MNILSTLKLVTVKRQADISPILRRRNLLLTKIWEQTELAKAQMDGRVFAPVHIRTLKDAETGERRRLQVPKRVKPWWFTADNGRICLSVRYGTKNIELAKGKSAIEVGTFAEVIPTLNALKTAIAAGELDTSIETVSNNMQLKFSQNKQK